MNANINKLMKLNELVTRSFRRKHIIVLNPEDNHTKKEMVNSNIIYDKADWKIPEEIRTMIEELSQNVELSNEDKILSIYERLCQDYVYDDNLISYIHKIDDDSYALPDWYGRDVGQEWEENREQHNRRVCYEVSRYLAKALKELFKDDKDFNICILWDKGLTHYFVGLTCKDYSITLDLDDFNNIKDLTRVKAGLTAEGIVVLEDKKGIFKKGLQKFNENRCKDAIKKIEHDIDDESNSSSISPENSNSVQLDESDNIIFLRNAIEILKNKHGIDSQGIYEYIKEIVDITLGPQARKKVWKEIKGKNNEETRYIRCLLLDIDNQKYILDVDSTILRIFDEEELTREDREFIPYKELLGEELISYRSRKDTRYNGR